jgi:translation elongation factor EF-Tu-like GTPase
MSGNSNRSARKGFPVEKEKIENLQVQVANMLEYVRVEVKAAEDQYNFSPDKGVARYMRALGRLEGIQQVNKIIVELFDEIQQEN